MDIRHVYLRGCFIPEVPGQALHQPAGRLVKRNDRVGFERGVFWGVCAEGAPGFPLILRGR